MKKALIAGILFLCIIRGNGQTRKISIVVDERVELITAMQLLFDYPLVGKADIIYKNEALAFFAPHKEDTTVKYLLDITQKYFSFVKPFNYIFHYSFPALKQLVPFSDYENETFGFARHGDSLQRFLAAIKQFYTESHFHDFFAQHTLFYERLIAKAKQTVDTIPLVDILEAHYGMKQHAYTLILSPLFIEAGMSTWIKEKGGNDLYSIIAPNLDSKDVPDFDPRWMMQYLVFHEFSHPFCNPLIDKYYPALEKDSVLLEPIRKALKQQGSATWKDDLCEFLTRANEIVLVQKVFGKGDGDRVYYSYLNQKWIYIMGLVPIIQNYQTNRSKYKTLDDIMPEVIAYFDGEAKKLATVPEAIKVNTPGE